MTSHNADDYVNSSLSDELSEETVVDDLSFLPLEKDDFSICELCGRIGVQREFYAKNTKYCSQRCLMSSVRRKHCNWKFVMMDSSEHMAGLIPLEPLPQLQTWHASFNDIQAGPIKHSASMIANSYEWKDELFGCDFLAAPVSLFKHAPLHEMWDNTFEGMKVEVKNTDVSTKTIVNDFFWVATVLKVKGYMGMLRYEGFGSDDTKDFWVNLCCSEVHPVGWCATRGKPLIPPATIEDKYTDWKKFLVKQLTGARTLPANFYSKLNDSIKSRFSVGNIMEVVDKNRISQVKVASIYEIVGKRLHVKYYDSAPEDNGFWCHEDSPLIHPVGWAFRVGHPLDAPTNYCQRVAAGRLLSSDSTPDVFYKYPNNELPLFCEGMKLEAIDPLNLSSICAATVMQILNEGYMMIRIDCYPPDATGADWFCYHQRSPCIFPVGFALANNIPLKPPHGYTMPDFKWEDYLSSCNGSCAPRESFSARGHLVSHGFVAGMKVECADLMDPRLVCVATIARVVADLLRVHFDGWGDEYDQWLWAHSTDMYPVGWCRAVGHRLEGPLVPPPPRPRRTRPARAPRRRKRPAPPHLANEHTDSSDVPETKSISPITTASEMSADVDTHHSEMSDVPTHDSEANDVHTHQSETNDVPTHPSETSDVHTHHSVMSVAASHRSETSGEPNEKMDMENNMEEPLEEDEPVEDDAIRPQVDNGLQAPAAPEDSCENMDTSQDSELQPTYSTYETIESSEDFQSSDEKPSRVVTPEPSTPLESEDISEEPPESEYDKVIPRLVNTTQPVDFTEINPEDWTPGDVARFLTVNDCQPYCINFAKITGPMMLLLTKDEIIELLEMKVGPSLKIFDLIQQLKCKIKQPLRKNSYK